MKDKIPKKYLKYEKCWKYLEKNDWILFRKRQYAVMDNLIHCFKRVEEETKKAERDEFLKKEIIFKRMVLNKIGGLGGNWQSLEDEILKDIDELKKQLESSHE